MVFALEQKDALSAMLAEHGFFPLDDLTDPDVTWGRGGAEPGTVPELPYISINFAGAEAATGAPPYSLDVFFGRGDPRKDFSTGFPPDAAVEELFSLLAGAKAFDDVKKASDLIVEAPIGSIENRGFSSRRPGT